MTNPKKINKERKDRLAKKREKWKEREQLKQWINWVLIKNKKAKEIQKQKKGENGELSGTCLGMVAGWTRNKTGQENQEKHSKDGYHMACWCRENNKILESSTYVGLVGLCQEIIKISLGQI